MERTLKWIEDNIPLLWADIAWRPNTGISTVDVLVVFSQLAPKGNSMALRLMSNLLRSPFDVVKIDLCFHPQFARVALRDGLVHAFLSSLLAPPLNDRDGKSYLCAFRNTDYDFFQERLLILIVIKADELTGAVFATSTVERPEA